ncbi:MAG: DEAD/DEAH box helicase [Pirellulales bacterium]|nr:DEAD/DEAH box helicase [Pirellulales bacterium]
MKTKTRTAKTKKSKRLTLKDRLSHLTYYRACQLLGPEGAKWIRQGAAYDNIDIGRDVYLRGDLLRVKLRGAGPRGEDVVATITTMAEFPDRLRFNCTACETMCEHVGAAVSLVLEEKTALGLAAVPDERQPLETLTERELMERALAERADRAKTEKFRIESTDPKKPWTDYTITSALSGKSYRVALRGEERGDSFCSCPDFRTNTLGTCKHILHVLSRVRRRFPAAARRKPYRNREAFVHVFYGEDLTLRFQLPDKPDPKLLKTAGSLANGPVEDVRQLVDCLGRLERLGHAVTVYPDAEELIQRRLFERHMTERMAEIRKAPARHPLRKELLKVELLPYQLEGIAFAAGMGRAILADDMGLGKTIQGVGTAEILAREAGIGRVLVVCPASVKSQWRSEIRRFCDRDVQLVAGGAAQRALQYETECFFTVCNYEQVLRDILAIERVRWDLIILDEGQRIKNWESKTARVIKGLRSPYALVLSGTPLENRLDELYSVVQFVDDRRLPPAFRFFHRHRVVDEKGKVLGYKNLDQLRTNLRPILLRRTRQNVLQQLPPRTSEIVRIPPTDEQIALHCAHMRVVSMITRKAFISEMDLLRLQKALLMCRMSANSTYLVEKQPPGYSSKLEYLSELVDGLFAEADRKALLFSEWTTMLDLIEPMLAKRKLDYVRLDGSVPQKKRQQLVGRFQEDPRCRLFITTNAGSTGLNLQAANTVINVDLPWNPAVLEQRIGRAHRMGQRQPVQVYVLVTEGTIEESLLGTLSAKHDLALAALDSESDVTQVDFASGIEELRQRLEVLLGAKPEAPVDITQCEQVGDQAERLAERRDRVAAAGGEMLGAVFHFLGELVADASPPAAEPLVAEVRERLTQCVEEDSSGRPRLTVTLPDRGALDSLAQTLARLMVAGGANGDR